MLTWVASALSSWSTGTNSDLVVRKQSTHTQCCRYLWRWWCCQRDAITSSFSTLKYNVHNFLFFCSDTTIVLQTDARGCGWYLQPASGPGGKQFGGCRRSDGKVCTAQQSHNPAILYLKKEKVLSYIYFLAPHASKMKMLPVSSIMHRQRPMKELNAILMRSIILSTWCLGSVSQLTARTEFHGFLNDS